MAKWVSLNTDQIVNIVTSSMYSSYPRSYFMYHQFNIQQIYVLHTQCIYVFHVDLRTNRDISLHSIN
jgi:hypothetical protein